MDVIALYNGIVFKADQLSKYGIISESKEYRVDFIEFFKESEDVFLSKYKAKFPNYSIQIYKHKKKFLSSGVKMALITYIKSPKFLPQYREYQLSKLLNEEITD